MRLYRFVLFLSMKNTIYIKYNVIQLHHQIKKGRKGAMVIIMNYQKLLSDVLKDRFNSMKTRKQPKFFVTIPEGCANAYYIYDSMVIYIVPLGLNYLTGMHLKDLNAPKMFENCQYCMMAKHFNLEKHPTKNRMIYRFFNDESDVYVDAGLINKYIDICDEKITVWFSQKKEPVYIMEGKTIIALFMPVIIR